MTKKSQDDKFEALWSTTMGRRTILRSVGVGAGALMVGSVVSACSEGPVSGADGGTLKVSMSLPFLDLDPAASENHSTLALCDYIYEQLYRWDRFPLDEAPKPVLAAEMPREITPKTYRVSLRKGVTFHDGSPLTADDVVFSLKRLQDPDAKGFRKQFLQIITAVRTIDSHEIELELRAPTTLLAQRLALVHVLSKSAVEASEDALKMKPVGTGPYRVVSGVSGERITLKRFKKYSGPYKFNFDQLKFDIVTDSNSRVSRLLAGDTDVIEAVPYSAYSGLTKTDRVKVKAVPGDERTFVFFNCGKPPFDDVRARRAVLYAIDRDSITKSIYFGKAEAAWAGQIRSGDAYYSKPERIYRHDTGFAKRLLADAGLGDRAIPIDFVLPSSVQHVWLQAPIIEQNLRDAGFEPNIVPSTQVGSKMVEGDFHAAMVTGATTTLSPTAEYYLRLQYTGNLPRTLLHWDTKELSKIEQLLDAAQVATSEVTFRKLLAEVQNMVQEEVPLASLHWFDNISAWSDKAQGFHPLPLTGLFLDALAR